MRLSVIFNPISKLSEWGSYVERENSKMIPHVQFYFDVLSDSAVSIRDGFGAGMVAGIKENDINEMMDIFVNFNLGHYLILFLL